MMNDQQSQSAVAALLKVCRKFRTHDEMSMATGVPVNAISAALSGRQPLGTVYAALMEKHTGGEVKRHELRPDMFPAPVNARSMDSITRTQGLRLPYVAPKREKPKSASATSVAQLEASGLAAVVAALEKKYPNAPKRAGAKGKTKARKPKVK